MSSEERRSVGTEHAASPRGLNWLAVFGVVVLAALIFFILWVLVLYTRISANPLYMAALRMDPYITEIQGLTRSELESQCQVVQAADHAGTANPVTAYFGFQDAYVLIEGQVNTAPTESVAANLTDNIMSTHENYGAYVLADNLILIDIEQSHQSFAEGTAVRGMGRLLIVKMEDIWDLPLISSSLEQEAATTELPEGVVFVISKELEVVNSEDAQIEAEDSQAEVGSQSEETTAVEPAEQSE